MVLSSLMNFLYGETAYFVKVLCNKPYETRKGDKTMRKESHFVTNYLLMFSHRLLQCTTDSDESAYQVMCNALDEFTTRCEVRSQIYTSDRSKYAPFFSQHGAPFVRFFL